MERRLMLTSKVGLTLAVVVLVALQSTVTVNAITCDPHCAPKSGCLRKGPGRCDRLCVPIDIYRLNSDYRCVPRCGGNCLYCASYMNCGGCRIGYKPKLDTSTNMAICVAGGCDPHCTSDCKYYLQCNTACAAGYYLDPATSTCVSGTAAPAVSTVAGTIGTGSTVAVTVGTGSTVAVTLGTGSTVAVTTGTGTVAVAVTTPPVPPTTATTVPPTTTALVCDPNCDSASGCTQHRSGFCDSACNMDYYLTATYICGACDPYCNAPAPSCTSAGTCSGPCDAGYTVFTATEMCAACSSGCTSCTSPGTCTSGSCDSNSVYDSSTGSCLACDPYCTSGCNTPSFCDALAVGQCSAGYGHTVTKKCGACDINCSSGCNTQGAGLCDTACNQGYYFDSSTHTCADCQTPDPSKCQSCGAAGSCDVCVSGALPVNGYCS